jgi:hypothetical protein
MSRSIVWRFALAGVVFFALAASLSMMDWQPYDWQLFLRPAALNWQQPYRPGVSNPPWLFFLLHPLARLKPRVGHLALVAIGMVVITAFSHCGASLLAVFLSAPFMVVVLEGQIDALVLAAFLLPFPLALSIVTVKPQGLWLAGLRYGGWPALLGLLAIVLLSSVIWPHWWTSFRAPSRGLDWWPWSIAPGLVLAVVSWQRRSTAGLCLASLLLSPYWNWASLLPFVVLAAREARGLSLFFLPVFSWAMILLLR